MTTIQGLVMNESGFIEKVAHSRSISPPSLAGKSPKFQWDDDFDVTMNLDMGRSSSFSTRASRPRISNKRTRPYQDTASRPNSHQRTTPPCRYFQAGKCANGDACRYRHVAKATTPESDLDQELLAFVKGDDTESPETINDNTLPPSALSKPAPKVTYNPDDFPDEEELYEVVSDPTSTISQARFNTRSNPAELHTYFIIQRQAVIEYEGKNVGILSGGVLLGVPGSSSAAARNQAGDSLEDATEPDMTSSSSSSPISNNSDHEQWKGPVSFEDSADTDAEGLVWADEEVDDTPMEVVDFGFNTYSLTSIPEVPSPPPVIHRIIRQADGFNRRHSLS
ncbi:zinc finger C-x8-C-x5-C-x3-H type protein [Rhizoctonia solani AG-3 Rhs1AP]|uniref:Zinc finger C-x8-C-x5-C-x3-H type protein n=2 Tax=Rhizoctonia solani AG-3 TaxID=1086053 RepID=A0A074S2X7_9AGAM|nr:zinc finger C-x8-C-x5-C-x3-H type protein [Rhizoctonia solani AG-3 Rhs1AP]KEP53614.1 zinc finger C-x8-C-x5-C-x3-H type protein [Rhizoctonia solani 123E]